MSRKADLKALSHGVSIFEARSIIEQVSAVLVSLRCPHCHREGNFQTFATGSAVTYKVRLNNGAMGRVTAAMVFCPNAECRGLVTVFRLEDEVMVALPPELLDFNSAGLPATIRTTLSEAVACHGAGAYRASAMMVRRLLEEVCDANEAEGDNLHKRLQALRSSVVLPDALFDAMDELKLLGNDAAHVEAKDYDDIGSEEAKVAIELAKEILKALYQLEHLVASLRSLKRNAGGEG